MRPLVILIYSMLLHYYSFCQDDNTPKYSNEFLQIGVSARSFALGLSVVSHVNDVTAAYWNPAGLNSIAKSNKRNSMEIGAMHSGYFGGLSNYDYVGAAIGFRKDEKLGLSIIRFSVDLIPDTRFLFDANGVIDYGQIRFFSSTDYAFLLSYARKIKQLSDISFGVSTKIIHRVAGDFAESWGFGFDVGVQKKLGSWQFGISARDIFTTFNSWSFNEEALSSIFSKTQNTIPVNSIELTLPRVIFGISKMYWIGRNLSILGSLDINTTFDGRRNTLINTSVVSLDPYGGIELGYHKVFFLRGGVNNLQQQIDFDRSTYWRVQPSAGVGLKIKEIEIDYALTDVGNTSDALFSHIFSLIITFDVK